MAQGRVRALHPNRPTTGRPGAPVRRALRLVCLAAVAALALSARAGAPTALVVDVDGMIHPITTDIVSSAMAQAEAAHAAVIIVRLNTPGGLMDAMRETIQKIIASPIPVVTYVAPSGGRAASAGFFILESGDVAAMAPGTKTGAAHPVAMGGEMDAIMKEKVENDAAAFMRSICVKRGRNAAVAETTVRESKSFTEREALDQQPDRSDRAQRAGFAGGPRRPHSDALRRPHGDAAHGGRGDRRFTSARCGRKSWPAIADPNIALVLLVLGALCHLCGVHVSRGCSRRA